MKTLYTKDQVRILLAAMVDNDLTPPDNPFTNVEYLCNTKKYKKLNGFKIDYEININHRGYILIFTHSGYFYLQKYTVDGLLLETHSVKIRSSFFSAFDVSSSCERKILNLANYV